MNNTAIIKAAASIARFANLKKSDRTPLYMDEIALLLGIAKADTDNEIICALSDFEEAVIADASKRLLEAPQSGPASGNVSAPPQAGDAAESTETAQEKKAKPKAKKNYVVDSLAALYALADAQQLDKLYAITRSKEFPGSFLYMVARTPETKAVLDKFNAKT